MYWCTPLVCPPVPSGAAVMALYCMEREEEASGMLSAGELDRCAQLRSSRRRREWLAARVALKRLLLERGFIKEPLHCRIERNRFGKPQIRLLGTRGEETLAHSCSISHKDGTALVCLGLLPGISWGVDLEEISVRPWRVRKNFAAAEDALLDEGDPLRSFALLWACKEAASKVCGLGMRMDFRELRIRKEGWSRFAVLQNGRKTMQGGCFSLGRFALAFCYGRGGQDPVEAPC